MQAEGIFLDSLWWMHYSSKYSNLPHFYPKIHLSDAFKPILTSEILCYKPLYGHVTTLRRKNAFQIYNRYHMALLTHVI